MTARIATHRDVVDRTRDVLSRLAAAGVDVESVGREQDGEPQSADPLEAVREGTIDLALVGIGALRGSAADGLTTVAVLPRGEVRDVLVALAGRAMPLSLLSRGTRVGVAGVRRLALLAAHRPDVEAVVLDAASLREILLDGSAGPTRPADDVPLDAVVASAADARCAGLLDEAAEVLDPRAWLPEPGQGALALVARHPIAEATALDHLPTRTALRAELALLDALDVAPDAPLGCLAQTSGRWIRLWAAAASPDGRRMVRSDLTGPLDEPEALGSSVARQLEARGYRIVVSDPVPAS